MSFLAIYAEKKPSAGHAKGLGWGRGIKMKLETIETTFTKFV
jgi:hypothetical protein